MSSSSSSSSSSTAAAAAGAASLAAAEHGLDVVVVDVEHLGRKHRAVVVHLLEHQTVAEGGDLEHVEEGGLGHAHLVAGRNQGHILNDLNGTLGNLGGDLQRLEERGLLGAHAGILGGHHHVEGGEGARLGRGLHLVGQQHVPHHRQVLVGEHEADVLLDVGQQPFEGGVFVEH